MGFPVQWKVHRESQVICVHIPMNCLSDKLTIVLYGIHNKKLHKKNLSGFPLRGFIWRIVGLFEEFDTERITSFLIIQEPQSISNALVEDKKSDKDHGENADKGKDCHQQRITIALFEEY
jgi:hypothetical protein